MMSNEICSHFKLVPLADGIAAAIATDGGAAICNAGIVDLGGLGIIFDTFLTPQAGRDLRSAGEQLLGRPPELVINSHYHNDHTWGNQVFLPEAQIISSELTRKLFLTEGKLELEDARANASKRLQALHSGLTGQTQEQQDAARMWIGYYKGLVDNLPGLRPQPAALTFTGKLELHGDNRSAVLFEYKDAHTGSDSILHIPSEGLVFVSDLLFTGCHPYLGDGDASHHLAVLNELLELDAERYVPGHGPLGGKQDLRLMADYVEHCLETAEGLRDAGEALEDELNKLTSPPAFRGWALPNFYKVNLRNLVRSQSG